MRSRVPALLLLTVIATFPSVAHASVIYTNFGLGDSFDSSTGWSVSDSIPQDPAMPFAVSPSSDYVFTSVDIALNSAGGSSSLTVQLMSDALGLPGSIIETLTFSVPSSASIVSVSSVLMPTLTAGTTYWITTNATGGFEGSWQWTDPQVVAPVAFSFDDTATWQAFDLEMAAFRVNGEQVAAPVPEPASLTLLGLGLASMGARRWRQRKQ